MKFILTFLATSLLFLMNSCGMDEADVTGMLKSRYNKEFEVVSFERADDGHVFSSIQYVGEAKEVGFDSVFDFTIDNDGDISDNYFSIYSPIDSSKYKVTYFCTENVYNTPEEYLLDHNAIVWMSLETTLQDLESAYNEVASMCEKGYDVSATIKVEGREIYLTQDKHGTLKPYDEIWR